MISRLPISFLAAGQLLTVCGAQNNSQLSDVPEPDELLRRIWARSVVLGNYLYIDGGAINPDSENGQRNQVNSTLSVDLSKPWAPRDVEIRQIRKDAPVIMRQAIFKDSPSSFYAWGGLVYESPPQRQTQVWKFEASDTGGGSWIEATESNLTRSHGGAFVSTPGSGFYFGGFNERGQQVKSADPLGRLVPGFLQVNYTSQRPVWTNYTSTPYSDSGTLYAGSAHYVPTLGPNGLVMLLGGQEFNPRIREPQDRSMETLWFMDPAAPENWYSQRTSGNAPERRRFHCTVGAQSRINTYDDVWVLSLPGFFWKKADYRSERPRTQMSCVLAGQRQMIVVGGTRRAQPPEEKDPFPQGLGIFDLTKLEWKDGFDPGAATYDSPDAVKLWNRTQYSPEVAKFLNLSPSDNDVVGSPGDADNSLSPAAIGGAVGGSVVGVALISVGVFFLIRQRNKKKQAQVEEAGAGRRNKSEFLLAPTTTSPSQLQGEHGTSELSGNISSYSTAELQGDDVRRQVELDAQDPHSIASELDARERRINTEKMLRAAR